MQLRVYEAFLATCQYTQKWCALLKYKWEIVRVVVRAPVLQKVDSAIHWINHYPLDSAIGFPNTYSMDSDLSTLYLMDNAIHLLNNRGLGDPRWTNSRREQQLVAFGVVAYGRSDCVPL